MIWTVWKSSGISLWYDCWRSCWNMATSAWLLSQEKTTIRISAGPVNRDTSNMKKLNKTPGCIYKQAGFVIYWCSRKNGSSEPSPVQVVRGDTCQGRNRLQCFILVCMSFPFHLLCLSSSEGFFFYVEVFTVVPVVSPSPGHSDQGKQCLIMLELCIGRPHLSFTFNTESRFIRNQTIRKCCNSIYYRMISKE